MKILLLFLMLLSLLIWQRKGWRLAEVKGSYERVLREPWVPGQCKGL